MFIRDCGSGSAVLLLHGSPTAISYFDPLEAALVARHRVLIPEFPGYGRSPRSVPYRFDQVQDELVGQLRQLGVTETAVVGFSLGAYRALALALDGRVRVTAAVLMGGFAALTAEHTSALLGLAAALRKMTDFSDPVFRRQIAQLMVSDAFAKTDLGRLEPIEAWFDVTTPAAWADEVEASTRTPDLHPQLGRLTCKVLLRVGELDAATPVAYSEQLAAALPNAVLERVPGRGHALLIEDRDATVASICRALG